MYVNDQEILNQTLKPNWWNPRNQMKCSSGNILRRLKPGRINIVLIFFWPELKLQKNGKSCHYLLTHCNRWFIMDFAQNIHIIKKFPRFFLQFFAIGCNLKRWLIGNLTWLTKVWWKTANFKIIFFKNHLFFVLRSFDFFVRNK